MTHPDLIRELSAITDTFSATIDALNDASGALDPGEDEAYAYEGVLEPARDALARAQALIERLRAETRP